MRGVVVASMFSASRLTEWQVSDAIEKIACFAGLGNEFEIANASTNVQAQLVGVDHPRKGQATSLPACSLTEQVLVAAKEDSSQACRSVKQL